MKVIIIGGQGFVGKYLCRRLDELELPYISADKKLASIQVDITCARSIQNIDFGRNDIVVHLAARQYADRPPKRKRQAFFDEVNVNGLKNILAGMENSGCHQFIYFSSDMVYGLPSYTPIDVGHPKMPIAEYGISKVKAEAICQEYRDHGFNITIFRPRLIVGPGRLGVLTKLYQLILKNKPVPLIGDGSNYYQMISVFDCVSAIIRAIDCQCPNETYNLGSKHLINVYDLLSSLIKGNDSQSKLIKTNAKLVKAAIKALSFFGVEVMYLEQYALANHQYFVDIENTCNDLGWEPQYTDQEMLNQGCNYYRKMLP